MKGRTNRSAKTGLHPSSFNLWPYLLLGLLFFSYFGSLWVGALYFPHGYDWRRNVISNLLSPRDNPGWYWAPSLGVAVAGLCMLGLAVWMERELGMGKGGGVRRGAFLVGIGCLILSAIVVPQHAHLVMGMRHAHEVLARTAAVCLGMGMLCACRDVGRITGEGRRGRQLRILRVAWWVATVPPMAGAVGSGLVVGMTRLLGSGAAAGYFGCFRGTVFWHLAFWEWMGSGAVFLFFASGAIILREVKS